MVLESVSEQVFGVPIYVVIGVGLVGLIVIIAIIMRLRSRAGQEMSEMGMNEAILEVGEEVKEVKKKPREFAGEISAEEKLRYEAKIQQLTNMLNVERDKLKAKETEFKQQSSEFVKVAALKDEVEYLQKRLGELENEKNSLESRHATDFKAIEKKREDETKTWENKLKEITTRVEEEKAAYKAEFDRQLRETNKKHSDEAEGYKKEIEDLKTIHLAERRRFESDYEKRLADEKRRFEEKIEEVKIKTKDTIQKVTREKEDFMGDLREENDRLKKDIERLKERIRLLEVEHL